MQKTDEDVLYAAARALRHVAYGGEFHCFDDYSWEIVNKTLDRLEEVIREKHHDHNRDR